MWLIVEDGVWRPGIGDPTVMGWLTVLVYFVTAYLCFRCFDGLTRRQPPGPKPVRLWWLGLAIALVALGVNKQLDLQSLVTTVGRSMARSQGWYESRRTAQFMFIAGIGVAGVAATVGVLFALRRWLRQLRYGIIGFGLLSAFVVIRAASFHHVDELLGAELFGLRFNWLMELGALVLIARGAVKLAGLPPSWRRASTHRKRNRLGREEVPIEVQVRALPPKTEERR